MDNAEEIMHSLEEFCKLKPKDIPRELEDYLGYVAKTGDPVFKWSIIKCLFREKMLNVITDFYETTLTIELPPCPNVDPFNYERMKSNLLEKLDSFSGAPFTVQRISELLTNPWKEYNRADKFMRAIEKNILVVSTREPGRNADNDLDLLQDTSFNGIPGPIESGLGSSFSCNDIAHPDSSSTSFDVSSGSQIPVTNVHINNISNEVLNANVEQCTISDTVCNNELIIRSEDVSQEIVIEEKEAETVICSTVNGQIPIEIESPTEHILQISGCKITDLTNNTEASMERSKDSEILSNTNVSEEIKEPDDISMEISVDEIVGSSQDEEKKMSPNILESNNSIGNIHIGNIGNIGNIHSPDNSEGGSNDIKSNVLVSDEEIHPTECDTSNSIDSETSNSYDSEVESKPQNDDQHISESECKVESSEVNEVPAENNFTLSEVTDIVDSSEVTEPSVSTESCPMDVDETHQISEADQSQS